MGDSSVDWSAVQACYGPATSVPSLIDQLGSPSHRKRDEAISGLWQCLCHQGTVYEASAYAVPLLFEAAKNPRVTAADRNQLLALVVHIGLGEATTWRGYTPWKIVQDCAAAVSALLPDLADWAITGDPEARRWTIALGAYHPEAWASLRMDIAELMPTADRVVAELVRHAVSGTLPDQALVDEVVASDDDLRDYYQQVVSELPPATQVRRIVLELAILERL